MLYVGQSCHCMWVSCWMIRSCMPWYEISENVYYCNIAPFFSVQSTEFHRWQSKLCGCLSWWVTVFSPNDISGLRRPTNVKFCTKVASSTRMMCALRFLEKSFNCSKICKKRQNKPKCKKWTSLVEWQKPKMRSNEDSVTVVTLLV